MMQQGFTALIHLVGFLTGLMLFSILVVLTWPGRRGSRGHWVERAGRIAVGGWSAEGLLFIAGLIGSFWNLGALVVFGLRDWGGGGRVGVVWPVALDALVFGALGFLPAVVVHSALTPESELSWRRGARWVVWAAYGLSSVALAMHLREAVLWRESPSVAALRMLTIGFGVLTAALVIEARRSSVWKRLFLLAGLSVFAVSALHLSRHIPGREPWFVELIGHHASLPLVLAMLYQDYRFALADIFLKRALAVVALLIGVLGGSFLVAAPYLAGREWGSLLPLPAAGALLTTWFAMTLAYPRLRKGIDRLVDTVILRRGDYAELRDELSRMAGRSEDAEEILNLLCARLREVFTASEVVWEPVAAGEPVGREPARRTELLLPTQEGPFYRVVIGELSGGRKFLSDDLELLEWVALMLARRLDAIRVAQERYARSLREQEMSKLAAESELRALRAQLNPHFLFNALTTIGYLIRVEPDRALETLMRLTGVLRSVLRSSSGELVTLGEEIGLIEAYLGIELARFEERLRFELQVSEALRGLRIPPLLLQPLVENAIKHGITPSLRGGEIIVSAGLERTGDGQSLRLEVRDTGVGIDLAAMGLRRDDGAGGVGLANIRRRLQGIYGEQATLEFASEPGKGTRAVICLPVSCPAITDGGGR